MAHNLGVAFSHLFSIFLAHWIRISDILSWVRNSYLTHVILSRLSYEGCTLVVLMYENSRTWSSSDVIVMSK